jgi:hypothetical protein
MGEMMFDLVCRQCGLRSHRRWLKDEVVCATQCPRCGTGMSVVGIAFFAEPETAAA